MPDGIDPAVFSRKFDEFFANLAKAQEGANTPAMSGYLRTLEQQLRTVQEQYVSAFAQFTTTLEAKQLRNAATLAQVEADFEKAKKAVAQQVAAAKAPKPPKAPADKPIDPDLGSDLRSELLRLYGPESERPKQGDKHSGDELEHWILDRE